MTRITSSSNLIPMPSPAKTQPRFAQAKQRESLPLQAQAPAISGQHLLGALQSRVLPQIRFGGVTHFEDVGYLYMSGPNPRELFLKTLQEEKNRPTNIGILEETDSGPVMMDLESKLFNQLGVIAIEGGVSAGMASRVTRQIQYLVSKRVNDDDETPIFLMINSPGGSVLDGNAILDCIDMAKNTKLPNGKNVEVVSWINGIAASMGSVIAASANRCYMTPRSRYMLHEVSSGTSGKTSEQRESIEFSEELENELLEIYVKRTGYKKEDLKEWLYKKDRWLNPQKSMEMGLADGVVTSYSNLVKSASEGDSPAEKAKPAKAPSKTLWEIDPKR